MIYRNWYLYMSNFNTNNLMMEIKDFVIDREKTLSEVNKLKDNLIWMENQLNDLPFYAEYIEAKAQLMKAEKELKWYDKDIFTKMTEDDIDKFQWENYLYHIKVSTKASIQITDESLLPEEAFCKAVKSKTEIGKLILKAQASWEVFPWAEQTFSRSLGVI